MSLTWSKIRILELNLKQKSQLEIHPEEVAARGETTWAQVLVHLKNSPKVQVVVEAKLAA